MPRKVKADHLPSLLKPGMTVFVQASSSEPVALIDALKAVPSASTGVHYISCQIPGLNRTDFAGLHPDARSTNLFVIPEASQSYRNGKVRFMPLAYSAMYAYLGSLDIDLALIQVRPGDAKGRFTLGGSAHFAPAILDRCKVIVAEVNEALPRPGLSVEIDEAKLDYMVEVDHPLPEVDAGEPSSVSTRIAAHVAGLVRDGDYLQVGIGKLPGAVLQALVDHRFLRCRGGLVSEMMIDLQEAGALDPASPLVCTSVLGPRRLYDWADGNDNVHVHAVGVTHDLRRLAAIDSFVAINSALSIDLSGQANAETRRGRQVGGSGGLTDFARAATLSENGRSILALPATAGGGKISRITSSLELDTASCARVDADYVVTEHGVATLRHQSLAERAKALIAIAEPSFREELEKTWHRS